MRKVWQYWKKVVWHLQICNGCFTQVIESWPSGLLLLLPYFIKILVFNANSVDLDQMLISVASDLAVHFANVPFMGHFVEMG